MFATHLAELWKQTPQRPEQQCCKTNSQWLWSLSHASTIQVPCPRPEGSYFFRTFELNPCDTAAHLCRVSCLESRMQGPIWIREIHEPFQLRPGAPQKLESLEVPLHILKNGQPFLLLRSEALQLR